MRKSTKKLYMFLVACMSVFAVQAQTAVTMFSGEFDAPLADGDVVFAELTYTGGTPNLYFGFNQTGTVVDAWNSYSAGFNMNTANLMIKPRSGSDNFDAVATTVGEKFQVWFQVDVTNQKYSFKAKTKAGEFTTYGVATPAYEYDFRNKSFSSLTHYIAAGSAGSLAKNTVAVVSAIDDFPADYAANAGLENIVLSIGTLTFDEATLSYNVDLPKGTTSVDVAAVTAVGLAAVSGGGTIDVTGANPKTTIKVTSPDGLVESAEYVINFNVKSASDDATLSALNVNGVSISGFSPDVTEYSYSVPAAANAGDYTVTAAANDASAIVAPITQLSALPGDVTVTVTAENGDVKTYTVKFMPNYMLGWNNDYSGKTPNDLGWTVSDDVTINWGVLNENEVSWRDNVGAPVNNGTDAMVYTTLTETKLSYQLSSQLQEGKTYKLSGKFWRRNGGGAKATFIFSAEDAFGEFAVAPHSGAGNNIVRDFAIEFAMPEAIAGNTVDFSWLVNDVENWQNAGIWNLVLVETGDADYKVTFNSNGGNAIAARYAVANSKILKPTDPTNSSKSFAGWYSDSALTTEWEFENNTVTEDMTLYAKWTDPTSISTTTANAIGVIAVEGGVNVTVSEATQINIVSVLGQVVAFVEAGVGTTFIQLPAGMYILNGMKAIVK